MSITIKAIRISMMQHITLIRIIIPVGSSVFSGVNILSSCGSVSIRYNLINHNYTYACSYVHLCTYVVIKLL